MKIIRVLPIFSFLALSGGFLSAANLDRTDTKFVNNAARGGEAEVKLGHLAEQKGSNQAVRDFGQRMVKDHTAANDKLKTVASEKGITWPSSIDAKDQVLYDRLSKLSGTEFDRVYINAMVRDHTQDVSEFRHESQAAKDQAVRSFASDTLPTLEDHLKEAKQVQQQVGATSSK